MTDQLPTGHLLRRGFTVLRRELRLHPRPFVVGVSGATVYACMTVAQSFVLGKVVDRVVTPRFTSGHFVLGSALAGAIAIVAVGIVKAAAIVTRRLGAGIARFRVEGTLSLQVTEQYQRMPLRWHRANAAGELLAHAGQDVEAATEVLNPLPFATGVVVMVVVAAVWLLVTDPFLAAVGFVVFPSLFALNIVYQRKVEVPATRAQASVGEVSTVAHESFDGALVVKTLGAEDAETARFRTRAEALRDSRIQVGMLRATFEAALDALPSMAMVVLLVLGTWRIQQGAITAGTLVAFVNLFTLLVWPLRLIAFVLEELPRAVAGYDRVGAVLALDPPVEGAGLPVPEGPLDLVVEHLSFSYDGVSAAIDDVSFRVPAGSTIALVGPTGSGKSTLTLLLGGLLEPDSGHVRLGGKEAADLDPMDRAKATALAFQEPFLFGTTVAENVLLGLPPGDEEAPEARQAMVAAARLARADEFVGELPDGYDTVIGERGATLSGGQRQRVALARSLVRGPRLLILDDATSSVDPSTEADILSGLGDHLSATTTIVVASRPATIALADRVLLLVDGQLVAEGTHDELLAAAPVYAHLVQAYEAEQGAPS